MTSDEQSDAERLELLKRLRREPPPLVPVSVVRREEVSPRMLRVTFEAAVDLEVAEPAASIRLLVPTPGTDELVIPEWNGNEFLLPDGSRPALRTFTPLRVGDGRVDIEVVRHPGGAVSEWAESVEPGDPAAISGPGSGFTVPTGVTCLIVLADETALPAVTQLIDVVGGDARLVIHLEVVTSDAEIDIAVRPDDELTWHVTAAGEVPGGRLVEVVRAITELDDDVHVWAAGEASAMHAVRTHLFDTLGLGRTQATVRGYWKPARTP